MLKHWLDLDLKSKSWFSKLTEADKQKRRMRHLLMPRTRAIAEIDKNLSKIKLPSRVLREMPQLCHLGKFKAMEYELLLFYGFFCFENIIKSKTLNNFKLLALILSKLCAQKVNRQQLNLVRSLVDKFLQTFEDIYGNEDEHYMWRSNIHHVAHLCDMVEWYDFVFNKQGNDSIYSNRYGPLFIQSAFFTENLFGVLARKVVTGTNVQQQGLYIKLSSIELIYLLVTAFNKYLNQFSVLGAVGELVKKPTTSSRFLETVEELFPNLIESSEPIFVSNVVHDEGLRTHATPYDTSSSEVKQFLQAILGDDWKEGMSLLSLKRARWNHPDFGKQAICTKKYNQTIATTTNNHCIKVKSGDNFKYYAISTILQDKDTKNIWVLGKEFLSVERISLLVLDIPTEFDYISTFDKISEDLTVLKSNDFCDLSTYCEDVHGKNYLLDIFSRHM